MKYVLLVVLVSAWIEITLIKMYWNSVCQICLPHGDLGILCSLYPLQLFCLYITLQHHMTCTNSHCSFNITCVLILDLVQPYF